MYNFRSIFTNDRKLFLYVMLLPSHYFIMYNSVNWKKWERGNRMMKVNMNVQTMYKGDLFRAGKVYEVNSETAERWIISGIAVKFDADV